MGAACCVASRDRTVPERTNSIALHRNVRYSPSWSFRWDNRGRVAGEVENPPNRQSHGDSVDGLEMKGRMDVEREDISDGGSPLDEFRTPSWQKFPIQEGAAGNLTTPVSGKPSALPKEGERWWRLRQGDVGAVLVEVWVQRDKGFGFVRYSNHGEAALAIQTGTGRLLCGKPLKCSWGSKPTPPGTSSTPLPPPVQPPYLQTNELLAYERQMQMMKPGPQALMHPHSHALKAMGGMSGAGGSQAIYDGGFQSVNAAQQLMYYQ